MSFLKKLLGGADPETQQREADALFEQGEYGQAKLSYEKAARALGRQDPERARQLTERADACRDAIARARMTEAERLFADGAEDLAIAEWEAAIETAADVALVEQVERRLAELAQEAEGPELTPAEELDADTRYQMISVSFDDDRAEEYAALGTPMRDAMLALYEERAQEARSQLEALVEGAPRARYLHYEVARARLLSDDPERAAESLEAFIESLAPGEGGEARLLAHVELAKRAGAQGDFDAAAAEFEAAIDVAPEDPRAYVAMARFFRDEGLADEAIDVLDSAARVLGAPHPVLSYEAARAHADAGRQAKARAMLDEAARLAPQDDPLHALIAEAVEALEGSEQPA